MSLYPTDEQVDALKAGNSNDKVVMLNLLSNFSPEDFFPEINWSFPLCGLIKILDAPNYMRLNGILPLFKHSQILGARRIQ